MFGQVHANLVLYKEIPAPRHRYKQIVVAELGQFQLRILEGEVIDPDPAFSASSEDAEVHFHSDLKSAVADAEKEFDSSVKDGWIPYAR